MEMRRRRPDLHLRAGPHIGENRRRWISQSTENHGMIWIDVNIQIMPWFVVETHRAVDGDVRCAE